MFGGDVFCGGISGSGVVGAGESVSNGIGEKEGD